MSGLEKFRSGEEDGLVATSVRDAVQVPFLQQAGDQMGVGVKVLAEAGQPYTHKGKPQPRVRGGAYVKVTAFRRYEQEHKTKGLRPFWDKAQELQQAASGQ